VPYLRALASQCLYFVLEGLCYSVARFLNI